MKKEKYGLFTAIAMIVGIVIGSGIFFKSDNILVATGGSVFLGVIVFILSAVSIIFGSLCISELAARTSRAGGIISYAEEFAGEKVACGFGWFQLFVYYPILVAVIGWVVGIYFCILFNIEQKLLTQVLIGLGFIVFSYTVNVLSAKLGGILQNAATVIKLIPLAVIAISGVFLGSPAEGFKNISTQTFAGTAWIAAVGPIAFSFDGWIVSTSIAHEIKDSKRNLPKALVIAPLFILCAYVLYFLGITSFVGVENVMSMGDSHVYFAAERLFGAFGAKLMVIFVLLSVMGTENGLILGYIRLPYSLALRGMVPMSKQLSVESKRLGLSVFSALFSFAISCFWLMIHYITIRFNLMENSDISEVAIVISYIMYVVLYYKVWRLYKAGEIKSGFRGIVSPLLAATGSAFILYGGLHNPLFIVYTLLCLSLLNI